jgi:uncharacterized protein
VHATLGLTTLISKNSIHMMFTYFRSVYRKSCLTKSSTTALVLFFGLFSEPVMAASFNCDDATKASERVICADFNLSVDDRMVADLYSAVVSAGQKPIKVSQREWIKQRDACLSDTACLSASYIKRITELAKSYGKFFTGPVEPWPGNSSKMLKARRLVHGILENIERHSILPKLPGNDAEYFSKFWPHLAKSPGQEAIDWNEPRATLKDYPLTENSTPSDQISFGSGISVDYDGINNCLKTIKFSDFTWYGLSFFDDGVLISSKCIDFYFPDYDGKGSEGDLPFPLISEATLLDTSKSLGPMSCTDVARAIEIPVSEICAGIAYQADIEYARTLLLALEENPYKFALWLKSIPFASECGICKKVFVAKEIARLSRAGIVRSSTDSECFFDKDGIYTCRNAYGEPNIKSCVSGSRTYQVARVSDSLYELRLWATNRLYRDRFYNEESKPKTTQGEEHSLGRLNCLTTNFHFPEWQLEFGEAYKCANEEDYTQAPNNMAYIHCQKSSIYCESNAAPMLCIGIEED